MGKHDRLGHSKHIAKSMKFKQPKPANAITDHNIAPSQKPAQGTTAQNMYK